MELSCAEITALLQTATQAARLAGKKAMEELHKVTRILKTPTELVTQADPLCQEIIIRHIQKSFPGHGILAEEGPNGTMLVEPPTDQSDIWWIIDPIDGTNNYAHGLLCFCVSIGIFHKGSPVVGVIYDPNTDSMFTAAQGIQACCNNRPMKASQDPISLFAGFAIDSHFDPAVKSAVHQIMRITRFRCFGSTALHMAYVAKGALIGALIVSAKLWDIAAGVLLIEQAGGIVTSLDGKAIFPIDMNQYQSQRFRLLSANPVTHPELLALFTADSTTSD
jgi:myo-inositol-1(or 4)-monophosphatase